MKALDLFGGKEAVLARMNRRAKKTRKGISKEEWRARHEEGDEPEVLRSYEDWKPWHGSIRNILKKPKFTAESEAFWRAEMLRSPICSVGGPSVRKGKELEMYVSVRAIEEL